MGTTSPSLPSLPSVAGPLHCILVTRLTPDQTEIGMTAETGGTELVSNPITHLLMMFSGLMPIYQRVMMALNMTELGLLRLEASRPTMEFNCSGEGEF